MSKKQLILIAAGVMAVSLLNGCSTAAGGNQTADTTQAVQTAEDTETEKETDNSAAEERSFEETAMGKTLVVYYSATGNTERVANVIAETAGADLFKLEPEEPYTDADLDWTDDNSRVTQEHNDPEQRDVELVLDTVEDWDSVSTVYIGYPIWWGIAAWPVDDFIKSNDFTGKTVIPFCTSSSSALGESGELLAEMAGTGKWLEGMRFGSGVSEEDIQAWVDGLGL